MLEIGHFCSIDCGRATFPPGKKEFCLVSSRGRYVGVCRDSVVVVLVAAVGVQSSDELPIDVHLCKQASKQATQPSFPFLAVEWWTKLPFSWRADKAGCAFRKSHDCSSLGDQPVGLGQEKLIGATGIERML